MGRRIILVFALLGCADAPSVIATDECADLPCPLPDDGGGEGMPSDDEPTAESSEGGSSGPADSSGLPCEVLEVLRSECQECHGETPLFGAPMPLMDYEDLQLPAKSDPGRPTRELVAERLVDENKPMPPGGEIDPADRDVLLQWLDAGAPEDPTASCGEPEVDDEPIGPDKLPCEPDVEFVAHAPADASAPYHVPSQSADDLYVCFAFKNPVEPGTQGTAWAPIIDDARVLHHMVLYKTIGPALDDGVYPCSFIDQLANRFVAVWAPGAYNLVMPEEAGLDLDGGGYILQIHYNNAAGHEDALDRSGIAMCTTDQPRKHKAGSVTLGTFVIAVPPFVEDYPVFGRCGTERTALWPEEVHVALANPHMHLHGRSFETTVTRVDPEQGLVEETLVEVPQFDWNFHRGYTSDPPFVIHRGDEIHTKCVYDNPDPYPLVFGEQTNAEMCLNFMLVYPIDGIVEWNCGVVI